MSVSTAVEFGLDTYADITADESGALLPAAQVLRNVVQEAVLADSLGVDHFGVGEHHRDDFAVSVPDVLLAGIATCTTHIRLGTSVTVLSTDDPVRVYERLAIVDGLSGGRAQITAGRGSFTESFALFGFSLADYERLFDERLALLVALLAEGPVTWSGKTRSALVDQDVYPRSHSGRIPLRVGVGGTPESVVRAAGFDLPMALAIVSGDPARFGAFADLYRRTQAELGHDPKPISLHAPGYVADSDEQAIEEYWPPYEIGMNRMSRERGLPPRSREMYLAEVSHGALHVGSPESVAVRIARTIRDLGAERFDLKYSAGQLSHDRLMRSIELYATEVIPRVRRLLAE